jgi:hypothetical protein
VVKLLLILCVAFLPACASSWQRTALETPSHQAKYVPPTTATMAKPLAELRQRVEGMGVGIAEIPSGAQLWGLAGTADATGQRMIALNADLSVDGQFEVLAHEAAHILQPAGLSESEREVFAERVMIGVGDFYHYDIRGRSAPYLGRYKTGFAAQPAIEVDYRRAVRVLTGQEKP